MACERCQTSCFARISKPPYASCSTRLRAQRKKGASLHARALTRSTVARSYSLVAAEDAFQDAAQAILCTADYVASLLRNTAKIDVFGHAAERVLSALDDAAQVNVFQRALRTLDDARQVDVLKRTLRALGPTSPAFSPSCPRNSSKGIASPFPCVDVHMQTPQGHPHAQCSCGAHCTVTCAKPLETATRI